MRFVLALIFVCVFIISSNAQIDTISEFDSWSVTGGWSHQPIGLEYVHDNNTAFAMSAPINVESGILYAIDITVQVVSGSGVLEIGFGNDTDDFSPSFVRSLPALTPNSTASDLSVTYRLEFEFNGEASLSVIFRVQSTSVDFYVTRVVTQQSPLEPTNNTVQCTNYLGFSPFSIQRLLTCRSATRLVGHVDDVLTRLQHLKTKVVAGGARLTQVIDYGEWIQVLN